MRRRPLSFVSSSSLVLAGSILFGSGCGGGSTMPHLSLPPAEAALVELLPADAFFAARFDGVAFRALPNWPEVDAALESSEEKLRVLLHGTDHVYVAVGGLVDAPPLPPMGPDTDGVYPTRPEWADLAGAFQGRIPAAVAVFDGSSVSICTIAMMELEIREAHGFRYASRNGVTLATHGPGTCLVTFEPVMEHLLGGAHGASRTTARLGALGAGGDLGIASAAFDLESPVFQALVDGAGERPADATPESQRMATLARRIFRIVTSGVDVMEWRASHGRGRYQSETRLHASDADRGVMWREFAEVYFDILRAVADSEMMPEEGRDHFRAFVSETRVEEREDGFVIRAHIGEQAVTDAFEAMAPTEETAQVSGEAGNPTPAYDVINWSAAEIVAAAEPRIGEFGTMDRYERGLATSDLASAYATVGRFDEAKQLLVELVADDVAEGVSGETTAPVRVQLAELVLDLGYAEDAETIARAGIEACGESCGTELGRLAIVLADSFVARGRPDDALAALERASAYDLALPIEIGAVEVRLHLQAGRHAEAAAAAHALCAGRTSAPHCGEVVMLEFEASLRLGASPTTVARLLDRAQIADGSRSTRESDERRVGLGIASCTAGARRTPVTTDARDNCASALAESVALHGERHPETARVRLEYASTLTATRDTAGAAAQLVEVDASLSHLGPNHPLRAARSARPTAPARAGANGAAGARRQNAPAARPR